MESDEKIFEVYCRLLRSDIEFIVSELANSSFDDDNLMEINGDFDDIGYCYVYCLQREIENVKIMLVSKALKYLKNTIEEIEGKKYDMLTAVSNIESSLEGKITIHSAEVSFSAEEGWNVYISEHLMRKSLNGDTVYASESEYSDFTIDIRTGIDKIIEHGRYYDDKEYCATIHRLVKISDNDVENLKQTVIDRLDEICIF